MSEPKFIPGFNLKPAHENAPDWVICKGSFKVADLIQFLQKQEGEWINFDVKRSKEGKIYAAVDDWKPQGGGGARTPKPAPSRREPAPMDEFSDDDIPFISGRGAW